jgi:glycosyltransferase involved in cell wall biosynthesis
MPLISVVMSVYNGERYLCEAIDSILCQTFIDFEYIIVNDGSTDKSLEIIHSYRDERIILIDQQNAGLANALNNGIKISNGKYIARMDADDISLSNRLEKQCYFLESNPSYIIVGSNARIIDADGNYVYTSKIKTASNDIKKMLPDRCPFYHSSVMYRKEVIEKCGYYYEPLKQYGEDLFLWNKMQTYGDMANIEDALIHYRLVPSAATSKSGPELKAIAGIYSKVIKNGYIENEDLQLLYGLKLNRSQNEKMLIYYYHLAKKYLLNNHQPFLVRKNLWKSIKIRPLFLRAYFLLFLSFMPEKIISSLYGFWKPDHE